MPGQCREQSSSGEGAQAGGELVSVLGQEQQLPSVLPVALTDRAPPLLGLGRDHKPWVQAEWDIFQFPDGPLGLETCHQTGVTGGL